MKAALLKPLLILLLKFALVGEKTRLILQNNDNIKTINDLITLLKQNNENYKDVFKDTSSIKVSINMETARFEDFINDNDEVAFFPPMTGG